MSGKTGFKSLSGFWKTSFNFRESIQIIGFGKQKSSAFIFRRCCTETFVVLHL